MMLFVFWFLIAIFIMFLMYVYIQWRLKLQEVCISEYERITGILLLTQTDQNSIYNISGRVQGQNQTQYPDAYISIGQIAINNELNKPPKYDDAPPSYEEAIKLALAQSNSMQTFEAEQAQTSRPAQSDTATTSTDNVIVPAMSSRPTE